jgi:hypothetical protein
MNHGDSTDPAGRRGTGRQKLATGRHGARAASCLPELLLMASMGSSCRFERACGMKSLSSSSHHSAKTSSCSQILCAITSPGPRVRSPPLHVFRSVLLVFVGEMPSFLFFPCLSSACVLPTHWIACWKMLNFSI